MGQRKHDRDEREPPEVEECGSPTAPAFVAEHEQRAVDDQDRERDDHRGIEVAPLEPRGADTDAEREEREPGQDAAGGEPVERVERRHAHAEDPTRVSLQPSLLPDVESGHTRRESEAREAGEHQADVDREHDPRVVSLLEPRSAAHPGQREQNGRDRHDCEAEQPVARAAAPDQVGADDEPDEEVERARPGSPGKPVG